jgi:8-oxo-dGTP diphosphatase
MKMVKALFWLWRTLRMPDSLRWAIVSRANQNFLVGVTVVVFNDRQEVLLFEHTYRSPIAWGLPSGWLKRGEDPTRAIAREVFEESRLEVQVTGVLAVSAARQVPRIDLVYVGEQVGGSFSPSDEVCACDFFAIDALPPVIPNQRALILQALAQRSNDHAAASQDA